VHDNNGDDPTIQDHGAVLDELLEVVTSLTPKYPELIQQEMAGDSDEICDGHGD